MAHVLNDSDTGRCDARPLPAREHHAAGGAASAASYLPRPALAGCVRAYLSRRTAGGVGLPSAARVNLFPPTPTCVVVWVLEGHDSRLDEAGLAPRAATGPAPVLFSGPHARPSFSWNAGPVRFFTLLLYPDALQALTGIGMPAHLGCYRDFRTVFDAEWRAMADAVAVAHDDAQRVQLIDAFLAPRWAQARAARAAAAGAHRIADWAQALDRAARGHGPVCSERQIDRRIRHWTGQNLRHLRALGRMEGALLGLNGTADLGAPAWSRLALDQGFADQAHLCREFRRHLGLSPRQVQRQLHQEPGWVLRVWA